MNNGFDKSALTYDDTFTHSNIGRYLRERVHGYLCQSLPDEKKLSILELNCGTGEDAIYFARKGHLVTATDSSLQMLAAAKRKAEAASLGLEVKFEQLNINDLEQCRFGNTYDLVFSDFGGLNCISPGSLKKMSRNLKNILTGNGRFIAAVMSKYCLWEVGYFLLKGKINKSFRRWGRNALDVSMNGEIIKTYYYTPSGLKNIFEREFSVIDQIPIGLFLPPTYMESFFAKRISMLTFLNRLESISSNWSRFSALGDHFLIDMKVK